MVVPSRGRDFMLAELCIGHPGVSRMKVLARGVVWWPGLDSMVEDVVKSYSECQQSQPVLTSAPIQLWICQPDLGLGSMLILQDHWMAGYSSLW